VVQRDDEVDESEALSPRRDERRSAPLISKASTDTFVKVTLSAMVALLAFLLAFAYNGNRELGELSEQVALSIKSTDRRIDALESATDRRLTVLENRVERIWEGSR
jgi:hypothetical protein